MTTIHAAMLAPVGRDDRTPGEIWQLSGNLYDKLMGIPLASPSNYRIAPPSANHASVDHEPDHEVVKGLLKTVRANIVQSIRAFRVPDLASAANLLGHHFLYAHCGHAQTKAEVLDVISNAFHISRQYAKNFDALGTCLTDIVHNAGPQPGFIIVLEGLPCAPKFDKEARESLLDIFRDAADFWADKKVPFRVFYAFV